MITNRYVVEVLVALAVGLSLLSLSLIVLPHVRRAWNVAELLKAEDPGKRYVISAHAIPALLDECLGTKVSKMRWRSKDEALKLAECIRKEGGEAFFADNKHAGMIKRGYVDPYFPQEDSGSIWRLE